MVQYAQMFVSRTTGKPHYFKVSGSTKQSIIKRIVANQLKWKHTYNIGQIYTKNELGREIYVQHEFPLQHTKYNAFKHTNWGKLPTSVKQYVINSVWKNKTKPIPKSMY